MQTLAAGSLRTGGKGFTLLELLVVVAIMAIATAGVALAMRDGSQVQLERDAQRLAALLESARARSRLSGQPIAWLPSAQGFRFEGAGADDLPQNWLDPDTAVATGPMGEAVAGLQLGPEPIIAPQEVLLVSRSQAGKSARLATDGVRPFAMQSAAP